MARMLILKPEEQTSFDQPTHFTSTERKHYLRLTESNKLLLETIRGTTNKVCFLVNLGYFKATKKFYTRQFREADLRYAAGQVGIPFEIVNVASYDKKTFQRHRRLIVQYFGFELYSQASEAKVLPELQTMIASQKRPKVILQHLVESLIRQRVEVPTYFALAALIARELQAHKGKLLAKVNVTLTGEQRALLEKLLEQEEDEGKLVRRYSVTLLKRFSQSTRPMKIKANVEDVKLLGDYYQKLASALETLELPPEGLRYYAGFVLNAEVFQVTRREKDDQYLHLLAFVAHQFFRGQDLLVDVLLKTCQGIVNTVQRDHKEYVFEHRRDVRRSLKRLVSVVRQGMRSPLNAIEAIAKARDVTPEEKLEQIQEVFNAIRGERNLAEEELDALEGQSKAALLDAEYYDLLEAASRKLQNRVSDIVRLLDFKGTDKPLLAAVEHFREKLGHVNHTAPNTFLKPEIRSLLVDDKGNFRVSLYKSLLFLEIAEGLKAGRLHLKHSYKYRSLDDYLIPTDKWQASKKQYLERAGMTGIADWQSVHKTLAQQLDTLYKQTNKDILEQKNQHLSLRKKNAFVLKTPKLSDENNNGSPLSQLFPKGQYVSLQEVLHTINQQSRFLEGFEHWQRQRTTKRPQAQTFFAGIMGYGCNIGINKLLRISRSLKESEVENTINWYFSLDNVITANDKVVDLMDSMTLADLYRNEAEKLHTSSDGQKFEVSVESLLASHSFKYFGQAQGVSVYSFIDERNLAFYSTVISASEREVAYVIDGLMHNEVIQSDLHSTDTHGYSEVMFGVTHLLGFYFAPRIKGFARQRLYAFEKRSSYQKLNYPILPDAYIDAALIEKYWDDILRFVVTIKLKEATASQLFKRLNSYAKQHPLYQALKEFGKIIKSLFMLRYISDTTLRQAIEKQLNKGELGNRFNRAISFGGNQELRFADKEEQEVADACRRLIRNAVLCWNYLYLSQRLEQASIEEQQTLLDIIRSGSAVAWGHINMHGEYDFSSEKLVDSLGLTNPKLIDLNHLDIWEAENASKD